MPNGLPAIGASILPETADPMASRSFDPSIVRPVHAAKPPHRPRHRSREPKLLAQRSQPSATRIAGMIVTVAGAAAIPAACQPHLYGTSWAAPVLASIGGLAGFVIAVLGVLLALHGDELRRRWKPDPIRSNQAPRAEQAPEKPAVKRSTHEA